MPYRTVPGTTVRVILCCAAQDSIGGIVIAERGTTHIMVRGQQFLASTAHTEEGKRERERRRRRRRKLVPVYIVEYATLVGRKKAKIFLSILDSVERTAVPFAGPSDLRPPTSDLQPNTAVTSVHKRYPPCTRAPRSRPAAVTVPLHSKGVKGRPPGGDGATLPLRRHWRLSPPGYQHRHLLRRTLTETSPRPLAGRCRRPRNRRNPWGCR